MTDPTLTKPGWNRNAIISLVLPIVGFWFSIGFGFLAIALGVLGVIAGGKALREIRQQPTQKGTFLAILGIIAGVLTIATAVAAAAMM